MSSLNCFGQFPTHNIKKVVITNIEGGDSLVLKLDTIDDLEKVDSSSFKVCNGIDCKNHYFVNNYFFNRNINGKIDSISIISSIRIENIPSGIGASTLFRRFFTIDTLGFIKEVIKETNLTTNDTIISQFDQLSNPVWLKLSLDGIVSNFITIDENIIHLKGRIGSEFWIGERPFTNYLLDIEYYNEEGGVEYEPDILMNVLFDRNIYFNYKYYLINNFYSVPWLKYYGFSHLKPNKNLVKAITIKTDVSSPLEERIEFYYERDNQNRIVTISNSRNSMIINFSY